MAESIAFSKSAPREQVYAELLPQIEALIADEPDLVANLANIAAALKEAFDFFWVGFYLLKGNQLVLGPFQGPIACTRIDPGKGVCGAAFSKNETLIVPDVNKFPGHIACSSASRSEIVVPLNDEDGRPWGVLDVDSEAFDDFSPADAAGLSTITALIASPEA